MPSDCSSTSDYVSETEADQKKNVRIKKTFCQRLFPTDFKTELKCLFGIYIPCVLTSFFRFLNPTISVIMCGNLSKLEFVASSLANSLIYAFGSSIDMGFSTAFDTLFAQIYGCDQKKKMGLLLQKAVIIMTLMYILVASFHLNIQPVLILLKQDPLVSELTTRYISLYLPGLFFDFQFLTFSRYLQNQNIMYPTMISAFASNIINAISQYLALHVYGYGLDCSAILQGLSCLLMFSFQLAYILISKVYKETWDGFSLKGSLENWKIIFSLGLPGIIMLALEEWNFEVVTIIAGTIDIVQLGAQSIALECATVALISSIGLEIAVSMQIGQYLGSRDIDRLKTYFRISAIVAFCISILSFSIIFFLRRHISTLFSNDAEIQEEGSNLLVYIAFLQFIDIMAGIGGASLKACGRQYIGAVVMIISYYVIGLPLGAVLVFVFKLKIKGMWIGLMTAVLIEALVFSVIIHRTDWEEECNRALANAEHFNVYEYEDTLNDIVTEETPLITKSDVEGDSSNVREFIYENISKNKRPEFRRTHSLSERSVVTFGRRRSMLVFEPQELNNEVSKSFKATVILRIITILSVLIIFVLLLLLRIYLPKSSYLPCLPINNTTLSIYGINSDVLCNTTINNIMS